MKQTQQRLRVVAFVPYLLDQAPGQRYRIEQWAPYLREDGIDIDFLPFATTKLSRVLYQRGRYATKAAEMLIAAARRLSEVRLARQYDVAYLFREMALFGPGILERFLGASRTPVVFDFDDAIWVRYVSPANRLLSYLKFAGKAASTCRASAAVVVGNDYLAAYARRFNQNVHVIPSTISLKEYRPSPRVRQDRSLVIGWTGSHSSEQYLSLVSEPLRELQGSHSCRVVAVGAGHVAVPGVRVENRVWQSASEVADIADFDVGIMPVPDEPWARGKCSMKLIQYMGLAIPPVASPVGMNQSVVSHGENGLLAGCKEEWVLALSSLLADPQLRARLGANARRTAADRFSAESRWPQVAQLLRRVAQRAQDRVDTVPTSTS